MDIVNHPSATTTLPAPDDWDGADGPCEPLPVQVDVDACGRTWMHSFWKPSEADLKVLLAGGCLVLSVEAKTAEDHPVVALGVHPR